MIKKLIWLAILAVVPVALMFGCAEKGQVDSGRVIAVDLDKKTITLIRDKGTPGKPDYNTLPPVTYAFPTDPNEMGPEPKPGKRLNLDTKNREITIFDSSSQTIKKIQYELIDQKENVGKEDPLVANKKFPVVDREKRTVTIYSGRQKILTTFTLPTEYFLLPDNTWDAGDEVRIYFQEPGKALRLMNVTKTDIFKK